MENKPQKKRKKGKGNKLAKENSGKDICSKRKKKLFKPALFSVFFSVFLFFSLFVFFVSIKKFLFLQLFHAFENLKFYFPSPGRMA